MSFGANGMTWVLRKIQMQLFSYQKWLEWSSRMVFAHFVVPEPNLQEWTRNELNMSFGANGMTWVLRKIQMQLFSYQKWLALSSGTDYKRAKHEFWVKRDDLGVKKNSNATLFVPKVAKGFRTVCRTRTKTQG